MVVENDDLFMFDDARDDPHDDNGPLVNIGELIDCCLHGSLEGYQC